MVTHDDDPAPIFSGAAAEPMILDSLVFACGQAALGYEEKGGVESCSRGSEKSPAAAMLLALQEPALAIFLNSGAALSSYPLDPLVPEASKLLLKLARQAVVDLSQK